MLNSALRAGITVLALAAASAPAAMAQPGGRPPVRHPVQVLACPASIQVRMTPTSPIGGGWDYGKGAFAVTLDPVNHPRVEMGTLICYYQGLKQIGAFVISQPQGARHCTVRPDNKGFDCTL